MFIKLFNVFNATYCDNHVTSSSFTVSDWLSVSAYSAALYWLLEYRLNLVSVHPYRKPTKRCAMKMKEERNKKKPRTHKNVFNGRRWFINRTKGAGEMNRYEMLVNYS